MGFETLGSGERSNGRRQLRQRFRVQVLHGNHLDEIGSGKASAQASAAAGTQDVRLGGGVATLRQYLSAGLIDELHLVMRPVLLGAGENLLQGIDLRALGYACAKSVAGERATHVFLRKQAG